MVPPALRFSSGESMVRPLFVSAIGVALGVALALATVSGTAAAGPTPVVAQTAPAVVPADRTDTTTPVEEVAPTPAPVAKKKPRPLHEEALPILILVAVIAFVVSRLPRVELGHTAAFRRRRVLNWLPLGLTYAFLYMGRYNMAVLKDVGGISQADFGTIDAVGSLVYGFSFLLNGPLADRWGGRTTILIAAAGAAAANAAAGVMLATGLGDAPVMTLAILFSVNMYFQSFGAVSIVKVNAGWFHVRERGTFGGIFGILISLGIYFAFDWGLRIANAAPLPWLFWVPAVLLVVFFGLSYLFVRDNPSEAGFTDFDTADASSGDDGPRLPALTVIKRMLTSRIILVIALIEFCSGFLRQGILKWYRDFARGTGIGDSFVYDHWGMVSCIAGITGGIFAGLISDHLFHSRRAPVTVVLYAIMLVGSIVIMPVLGAPHAVSWIIAFMAMAIIGVHGMLSGTASQDFGGRKNAGIAVGLIDGFVYLGTALQAIVYGSILPEKGTAEAAQIGSWYWWPGAMVPFALIGLVLAATLWNARPAGRSAH
jgi:OPA family glycerol-3-phosphate transporter-like MFS transporter